MHIYSKIMYLIFSLSNLLICILAKILRVFSNMMWVFCKIMQKKKNCIFTKMNHIFHLNLFFFFNTFTSFSKMMLFNFSQMMHSNDSYMHIFKNVITFFRLNINIIHLLFLSLVEINFHFWHQTLLCALVF